MEKKEKKIIISLIVLVISIIIGFTLLSFVYNGNVFIEALVAIVVILIIIVLLVIIKNFYNFYKKE